VSDIKTSATPVHIVRRSDAPLRSREYRYGLGLTSQFYFCGLPLRLDTYSKCAFRCSYCFAHARGGAHRDVDGSVYSDSRLARRFDRILEGRGNGVLDELLANGQPIHFGGMSDPFSALERRHGASLAALKVLAKNRHPTVISTKSDMLAEDKYLQVLKQGRFIVQVSLSSMDALLIDKVDRGVPGPQRLMKMLRILQAEGIPTACRIQPLLPMLEGHASDVIAACADAGVGHVAVEHLKLGIEKGWTGTKELARVLKLDLFDYFERRGAQRIGREWVLAAEFRVETVLNLRSAVRRQAMTFGAADTDLLLLSDGGCCCSGADLVPGFENYFKFNFLEAARQALPSGRMTINGLANQWVPSGSIAEHVNSHSRLPSVDDVGAPIKHYIADAWNGAANGAHPTALHGVSDLGEVDQNGFKVYEISAEWRDLTTSRG
jgi:DNA repair photolyase